MPTWNSISIPAMAISCTPNSMFGYATGLRLASKHSNSTKLHINHQCNYLPKDCIMSNTGSKYSTGDCIMLASCTALLIRA